MGWKGVDPAKWAEETKAKLLGVFQESVQELGVEMAKTVHSGGRVPHKTGNLARSLLAANGSMPPVKPEGDDGKGKFVGKDVGPVLLDTKLGDTVYLGYQAVYARRVNYGFVGQDSLGRTYNQSGAGFVEAAAAKWQQIVARSVIDMRTQSGFSSTSIAKQMKGG